MNAYPQSMTFLYQRQDGTLGLTVYVQPKASRNRVVGLHGDAVKLAITAPPVDNQANKAIIAFLAKLFGISKSSVIIRGGQQSRTKTLILDNISLADAEKRLNQVLPAG